MLAGMSPKKGLEKWENMFPLDSWWRRKYKVAFGSEHHLKISQIDIYYDWLSDQINLEYFEEIKLIEDKKDRLSVSASTDRSVKKIMSDAEFDALDLSKFNSDE